MYRGDTISDGDDCSYFLVLTADIASARLGYVPVDETGKAGSYVYDADYVNGISNEDWVTKSFTFTLSGEQKICLVIIYARMYVFVS